MVDICRNGSKVRVNVVGAGVSSGMVAANGLGTGSQGSSCYFAPNWVDTGLQQANITFQCLGNGGGACQFAYDLRTSCSTREFYNSCRVCLTSVVTY